MNLYEKHVLKQMDQWVQDILKSQGLLDKATKGLQTQTQRLVPKKVQQSITVTMEKMIKAILFGSGFLTVQEDTSDLSLAERDYLVLEQYQSYQRAAVLQGIGLGAGGVILGLADLPTLVSIKIKFLFDCAKLYGFDPHEAAERQFMLHVFQLAFSGKEHRLAIFRKIEQWDSQTHPPVDWERFQTEYRDYIDLAKLLQLLPVVGSVAGGTSNHKLMNRLKVNAMNCYRLRILQNQWES